MKRQLDTQERYGRPPRRRESDQPDLLVVDLLNGDLTLEGWDLNDEEETPEARERVSALLTALREIEADVNGTLPADYPYEASAQSIGVLVDRVLAEMQAERDGHDPPPHWPRPPRRPPPSGIAGDPVCWGDANAILADYPVTREICPVDIVTWEAETGKSWRVEEKYDGPRPKLEYRMVNEILELARNGQLSRLRCCACGRWFYATRMHQRSHAQKCRQRRHAQTEEFKAERRVYMRWYYAMYQSPKAPRKKMPFAHWLKKSAKKGIG